MSLVRTFAAFRFVVCATVVFFSIWVALDASAQGRGALGTSTAQEREKNAAQAREISERSREFRLQTARIEERQREFDNAMRIIWDEYADLTHSERAWINVLVSRMNNPDKEAEMPIFIVSKIALEKRESSNGTKSSLPLAVERAIYRQAASKKLRFGGVPTQLEYIESANELGFRIPIAGSLGVSDLPKAGPTTNIKQSLEAASAQNRASLILLRSNVPVPALYRLSTDGDRLIGTDLSGSPIEGLTENDIQFVGINALLRGMQPAPVRDEPLRVTLLRDEGVRASSMDAAMLSLALMAQREYGVSAIEWVDAGAEASGSWRPFFAGSEASPMPATLLVGPNVAASDTPGTIRMYRNEAAGETIVSMQIVKATETRPGVFVRAVAKTNALARRIAAKLRAWWSPELAQRSDEDLQAELDTLVREQLSAYLNRNHNLAAQERPEARVELHIERSVNQMWVEITRWVGPHRERT